MRGGEEALASDITSQVPNRCVGGASTWPRSTWSFLKVANAFLSTLSFSVLSSLWRAFTLATTCCDVLARQPAAE